jgi:glyoxylate reductase
MTKPKILVSRRWPEAVETAMVEKYDVTFNIKDKPLSTNEFKDALSIYDAILPTVTDKISSEVFRVKNPRQKSLEIMELDFHILIYQQQKLLVSR